MTGQKNGLSFFFQFQKKGTDLCHAVFVQTIEWFIQDQKFRILHNGLRDAQPLPHPQRILSHGLFHIRIQPHLFQYLTDFCLSDLSV